MKFPRIPIASYVPLAFLASAAQAAAQVEPGSLIVNSPPTGNDVAIHRADGTLLAQSDGDLHATRSGVAVTHDLGWCTFDLRIFTSTGLDGWYMLRYDRIGNFLGEVYRPELTQVSQQGVELSRDGLILVADSAGGKVFRYRSDGSLLDSVDVFALGGGCDALCATDDGGFWTFNDGFEGGTTAFGMKFDRQLAFEDALDFSGDLQNVACASDGTFWTTPLFGDELVHYSAVGTVLQSFPFNLGTTGGGLFLIRPTGILANDDGSLWIAFGLSLTVVKIDTAGNELARFDSSMDVGAIDLQRVRDIQAVGIPTCSGVPNSTGAAGQLQVIGSAVLGDDAVTLRADSLPRFSFGFFLVAPQSDLVMNPGGSQGNLCLGGSIGRFIGPGQVQNTGTTGTLEIPVDLTALPTPFGPVAVGEGDTWHFQAWHRDLVGGVGTSNFTGAVDVLFY